MIDIKKAAQGEVVFQYYRDGALWYGTNERNIFPVPVEDIGNATFYSKDKGILFMRYMRKFNQGLNND
jgi:hypothetical protein